MALTVTSLQNLKYSQIYMIGVTSADEDRIGVSMIETLTYALGPRKHML